MRLSVVLALLSCAVFVAPPALAGGGGSGDIQCGCSSQRFETLASCASACPARPTCTGCMIQAVCPALKVPAFGQLYGQASGTGPAAAMMLSMGGSPDTVQRGLVAWVMGSLYKQQATNFTITIGHDPSSPDLAHLGKEQAAGHFYFQVQNDAFTQSAPAALVSSIGHELIHYEQRKRARPTDIVYDNIEDILDALREVEAWSWESGVTNFAWPFKNQTQSCESKTDQEQAQISQQCYEWKARHLIETKIVKVGNATRTGYLEKWLKQDPWVLKVWLPANPGWKTVTAGAAPVIPLKTQPGKAVDCASYL